MKIDRTMAAIALFTYLVFMGIIVFRVPRLDLGIVICVCLLFVLYDLWTQLFPRQR
ncbi:MAG: hypothetical protein AB7I79_04900 [Rhizobiaceae bacterium]